MKLERIPYDPGASLDFFEEGLTTLGALCSRSWHDRLEVVAEGAAARLWNARGELQDVELQFADAEAHGARDADRQVFPGCPLVFRLAESLRAAPPVLERVVLVAEGNAARPPDTAAIERIWRTQFPDTARFRQTAPFVPAHHFSLVALARCEIQAIDQHWSLHRVAIGLPDGRVDDGLARAIAFAQVGGAQPPAWPVPAPAEWMRLLGAAVEQELAAELAEVRSRQATRLGRELQRVDDYYAAYERELSERSRGRGAKLKLSERLAAARAEHARHRADQVARHEITIVPHIDALLLVAEPAWRAALHIERAHQRPAELHAHYIPRSRRWETAVHVDGQ